MAKTEFRTGEPGDVVRLTKKAVLIDFEEAGEVWVPFSVMNTDTLAQCVEGNRIERPRIEAWFMDREEIGNH